VAASPTQLAWRARFERVLRLAAPALDVLLLAGDRASRLADRDPAGALPPTGTAADAGLPARRVVGPGAAGNRR
jgi:hypothetical protein